MRDGNSFSVAFFELDTLWHDWHCDTDALPETRYSFLRWVVIVLTF